MRHLCEDMETNFVLIHGMHNPTVGKFYRHDKKCGEATKYNAETGEKRKFKKAECFIENCGTGECPINLLEKLK